MIRYKCQQCGAKLETEDGLAGGQDVCPICGRTSSVPLRKRLSPKIVRTTFFSAIVLTAGAIAVLVWNGQYAPSHKATSKASYPPAQIKTAPDYSPLPIEFLEERGGPGVSLGYYAYILIKPMPGPELKRLGRWLVARMRARRCDHLKVWVYYSRDDYLLKRCAIWMNATRPDYAIEMYGSVPERTTPQGLFEAYVKWQPLLSFDTNPKALLSCVYTRENNTLAYHDKLACLPNGRIHMPAVILAMGNDYLRGGDGYPCWSCIPGLKQIVVHLYRKNDPEPMVTVSFRRDAYELAARLSRGFYKAWSRLGDPYFQAVRRRNAKVMSEREYKLIADTVAREMYGLYADLWVEVYPLLRLQVHKKMGAPRPDFYRKYLFGGG